MTRGGAAVRRPRLLSAASAGLRSVRSTGADRVLRPGDTGRARARYGRTDHHQCGSMHVPTDRKDLSWRVDS
jgi:hypothetical protein